MYSSAVGMCSAAVFAYYFLSVCHGFFLISWARRNQNASISQIYNSLEHPLVQHLCICVCHFLYTTRSVLESGAPIRMGVRKSMVILVLTSLCFTAQLCKCTEVKPFEIVLNFSHSVFLLCWLAKVYLISFSFDLRQWTTICLESFFKHFGRIAKCSIGRGTKETKSVTNAVTKVPSQTKKTAAQIMRLRH